MRLNNGIFYRTYDDKTLLCDTYNHKYYMFSGSVAMFLDLIRQGYCFDEIIRLLSTEFGVEGEYIKDKYKSFLEVLKKNGIVFDLKNNVTLEEKCVFENTLRKQLYSVTFELTYNCNEHCKHCYICNTNQEELSLPEYKNILIQLKEMNVMNIVFTGGEVLCKKDFIDIYRFAIEQGFSVDIYTNGNMFTDSLILEVARYHPRSVHFSVYSLKDETHDYITGVKGSLKKTLDTAVKFIDLGIAVNFKTILLKNNVQDIPEIIDYANIIGATIQIGSSFQLTHQLDTTPLNYMLDEKDIMEFLPAIYEKMKVEKNDLICQKPKDAKICSAGFSSLSINPYGDIFPCISFSYKLGNARQDKIQKVWLGNLINKWRAKNYSMIEGCSNCAHSSICSFCPGIAMQYNGTPLKSYQNACINAKAVLKYIKGGE